jgi:hypothetical protein
MLCWVSQFSHCAVYRYIGHRSDECRLLGADVLGVVMLHVVNMMRVDSRSSQCHHVGCR